MTPEIKHELNQMKSDELRKLIDYCLSNLDTIDKKSLPFATNDANKISEYIDVLESRLNKPSYSPPEFSPATFAELKQIPATQIKSALELEKESEQMILDKEKQLADKKNHYKQKIINLGDWLFISKNHSVTLEKELDEFQQELNQITLKFAVQETDNENISFAQSEVDNSVHGSPIYDRLLFWKEKLQNSKQDQFIKIKINDEENDFKAQCSDKEAVEFEKIETEKELLAKIKNVKKQLMKIKTKVAMLKNTIKIEEKQRDYILEKEKISLSYTIKKQTNRNFRAEARSLKELAEKEVEKHKRYLKNQEKRLARGYDVKGIKYDKSYQLKLKDYEKSIGARIIKRLRYDISKFNQYKIFAKRLNWKLLPIGEMPFNQIEKYLQNLSKFKDSEFDYEKINKIVSLKADEIYCGTDQFEGYLVFCFKKINTAILDCPRKGNAIYIFGEDWKNLSCLSKFELLNYHSDKTKRIIHRGDWLERLKLFLKNRKNNLPELKTHT